MQQHINFITLGVADIAVSRRFYQDAFGWQETADSNDNIAFFQAGNALRFALYGKNALAEDAQVPAESSGFPRFALAHNVGSEAEVDALFATLGEKNATIVKAPHKAFWGGYSGYIADPDGFLWEIAYNPFLPVLR
ncbi:VOC family protein [Neisseria sp.]|uniref:VOC family protein n=1 Tax=Neisseria sp. TaxID=192066 RepID=UPI0026DAD1BF|nr:VOC family protein [Neisseria sp.]MDO4228174.1 VOC family protein [Neisseria sp.]